jgi:hypothetical protein
MLDIFCVLAMIKLFLIWCLLHADGPFTSGNTIAFRCAIYFAVEVTVADG